MSSMLEPSADAQRWVDAASAGDGTARFSWGWKWLARRLGPASAGSLLVVGARDGVGKSFLGLHILHEAARAGYPATYISLEDTRAEVGARLLLGLGHPNLSVAFPRAGSLRETMDAMAESKGLVVVDYLQEVFDDTGGAARTRAEEVARTAKRLKAHATDCGLPLVLLSQVAVPGPDEDPYEVPSRYRMQEAPAAINRMAGYVVMMGPERDGQHVVVELQKAKGAPTGGGARVRLRRGFGGRFERPTALSLDPEDVLDSESAGTHTAE